MKKIIIALLALALFSCTKSQDDREPLPDPEPYSEEYIAKLCLRNLYMDNYYYWYKEVSSRNAALDPEDYDIYDFFDAMLYTSDRWSWMCSGEYYRSLSTGVKTGTWGLSFSQAVDYDDFAVRVAYIFPNSPMEKYGVTRGARLDAIGGKDVTEPFTDEKVQIFQEEIAKESNSFTFTLLNGETVSFDASRVASLATRSSLVCEVYTPEDYSGLNGNVGYFHYLSFTKNLISDVKEAMEYFSANNVGTLILDMRYNGGGDVTAALVLASYIAPLSAQGKVFLKTVHNDILADYDSEDVIPENKSSLSPKRIYVIMGEDTASCSEIIINGLKPYMGEDLITVGSQSYGKPNGMYLLPYPISDEDYTRYNQGDFSTLEYAFLPICMYNMNSLGEQIPNDGFIPDCNCPDDLFHDFGLGEGLVDACLFHIVNGFFPEYDQTTPKSKSLIHSELVIQPEQGESPGIGGAVMGVAPRIKENRGF